MVAVEPPEISAHYKSSPTLTPAFFTETKLGNTLGASSLSGPESSNKSVCWLDCWRLYLLTFYPISCYPRHTLRVCDLIRLSCLNCLSSRDPLSHLFINTVIVVCCWAQSIVLVFKTGWFRRFEICDRQSRWIRRKTSDRLFLKHATTYKEVWKPPQLFLHLSQAQ